MFRDFGLNLLLLVNFFGVYVCYLLVLKQMNVHSKFADKICSTFSQSDCNNVLESNAAKLWGVLGWSEVGLGYFFSNVLMIVFLPQLIPLMALINIFTLPYSFWSIWYQKLKAKQWCPLCLIVQVLLWGILIVDVIFGYLQLPGGIELQNTIVVGCIYILLIFTFNLLVPKLSEGNQVEQLRQEINSIKTNEIVFLTLLKNEPYYGLDKSTSNIILGNHDGKILITVFTNPHCDPCARMHARIEELLKQNDELCIQYIFGSFHESLNSSNKFLIAIYQHYNMDETEKIYSEWFTKGKHEKELFFKKYLVNFENEKTETEFKKHELWKLNSMITSTPTIFVNGHKLPYNYKIEDFAFFSEL